jgi:hypothetical protein
VRVELRAFVGVPSLDFARTVVDFGEVDAGSVRTMLLGIENDGSAAARITDAASTSPFAAVTAVPFVAPAGLESLFEISFAPTSTTPALGTLTFSDATGTSYTVTLRGNDCANGEPSAYDLDRDGVTTCGGDCDDARTLAYPGAPELPNGSDDDCDGLIDEGTPIGDNDGDGYSVEMGDCNDFAATAHPSAVEVADGVDNDCNGRVDDGTPRGDDDGDGATEEGGDCNDADPAIGPHALEIPGNAVDEDCNLATL